VSYKWKPLQRATYSSGGYREEIIATAMESYRLPRDAAIAKLEAYDAKCEVWRNDLYQVQARPFVCEEFGGVDMIHLNIRRCDGAAVFDWRHRQLIKNQLVGAECEAFEIYPAESRLVDTSNKYHLWAFVDPTIRLPVSIDNGQRDIVSEEVASPPGMRQRRVQP
jgi:hypothetical protein